jgi:RNA polymerase sigma-70 factor (ECF subfamily)
MHSEEAYIVGVQQGDDQVFTALVNAYIEPLTRFAFGLTGVEDVAHDVTQEVFARVWQLGPDWRPQYGVAAYLFTAVRNRSLNWLKANHARQQLNDILRLQLETETESSNGPDADPALVALVRREFQSLTERQRLALQLRYEQELPMPQVAAILGIALRPAEKLVARALTRLRDQLAHVRHELE